MTAYTPSYEEWLVSALPQAQMEYADEGLPIPSYGELEPILRSRYVDYAKYTSKRNLCVWPDSTWCYLSDLEEYSWMSDDYVLVSCPEGQEDAVAKEVNSK